MARLARTLGIVLLTAAVIAGCRRSTPVSPASNQPFTAVVTIPPLKGLVEPLLPSGGRVELLIPAGVSEHNYELPPSKLAALEGADLVVYVGLGLEPQVEKFLRDHPRSGRSEVCFATVVGISSPEHADEKHDAHEAEEEHEHAVDPHLWLDPVMARRLVEHVGEVLRVPDKAAAELARIDDIDRQYREALSGGPKKTIVVGHAAYGWMAKRYGLEVVPIAGLNASEPTPAAIERAVRAVKEMGVSTVFVEPQLSQAAGKRIAESTGVPVRVLDPLGDGDWFGMMQRNLDALKTALGAGKEGKH